MTVEELIERLSKEPKWSKVLIEERSVSVTGSVYVTRDIDRVAYDHHLNVVLETA